MRARRHCLFLLIGITSLALAQPAANGANDDGRQSTVAWLRDHAIDVTVDGPATGPDVAAIAAMIGPARIVAYGEATHGTHELLAIRNRIFEYLVEHNGMTALAVETGFREALAIDEYLDSQVDGDPPDALVRAMMSWSDDGEGRGRSENRELLRWIHAYNRTHGDSRVHLYGLDLSGRAARGGFPNAAATLKAALDYVHRVDPQTGNAFSDRLRTLLPAFRTTSYSDKAYDHLPPAQRDAMTAAIADLNVQFQSHAVKWREATSPAEYDFAEHFATAARQLDGYFRLDFAHGDMTPEARVYRDSVMAENVAWIMHHEGASARVFVFAHDVHMEKGSGESMGSFMKELLGANVFTIGTTDAIRRNGEAEVAMTPQGPEGIGSVCADTGRPAFVVDLRRIPATGPIREWLSQPRLVNPVSIAQRQPYSIHLLDWYDALIFVRELSFPGQ